jgi:hypothetical protein
MQSPQVWVDMRSRMSREAHVRIWESLGVRFLRAARLLTLVGRDFCYVYRPGTLAETILNYVLYSKTDTFQGIFFLLRY